MFDLQQITAAGLEGLEEAVRRMPTAAVIAEASSGKIILVNNQARQMLEQNLGRSMPPGLGEIGDFGDLGVFRLDGRPLEMEDWPLVRSIGAGEEVRDEEYSYLRADGTRLSIRCDASPIHDDEGRIVAGVAVFHDITEQKRAEERLVYHARLLENIYDAVLATDERYVVTAWNKGAEAMYGWTEREALGRDVREVARSEVTGEQWAKNQRELEETGRASVELIAYRKDGTPFHVELIVVALRGERGEITGYLGIHRDVTERKRFESERQRLADIVQNSGEFIGIADVDWRPIFVNEAGRKMVGLEGMEEVRRSRVQDYLMPEDRATLRDEIVPMVMKAGRWTGEFNLRHFRTGEPIPVIWDIFRLDDPRTGEPINIATVTRDISERKRAEEALRENEGRLRFALEAGGLGSWELDLTNHELKSSENCKTNFGLTPGDDLSYERLLSMIHPDDRDPMRAAVETAIETGSDYEADYRVTTPGGEERWVAARGRAVYGSDGSATSLAGITLDITKRKRAEEESSYHARLLENISDAVLATDEQFVLKAWNKGAEEMYGWSADEVLGRDLLEVIPPEVSEERLAGLVRELTEKGRLRAELVMYRKDGTPIYTDGITVALRGEGGETTGYLAIHRDITERKRAEREIEARARQQAVVAELGVRALANSDLQYRMDDAVEFVARTLGVEYCKIVDPLPGDGEFLVRAGVGWREGLVGSVERADLDPQARYTLLSGEPVIVEDLAAEARFGESPILREHGVVSTVSVVIPGRDTPFGVLGAYTTSRRIFSEDDVNFLQAIANVLATAVERTEAEQQLREVREAERGRMARDLHDEALGDLSYALAEAQLVQSMSEEAEPNRRLDRLISALKRAGQQLRGAVYDLRLGAEQDKPFPELLGSLVELHRTMAPDCDIRVENRDGVPLGSLGRRGKEILRIIGEALTNARRHSGAGHVAVVVGSTEDKLWAEVRDDGRGFDPAQAPTGAPSSGMGTRGMRERARAVGGDLEIESAPGEGTSVRFEMVLKKARAEPEEEVRVLLVEDHVVVREAIAAAFEREAGFEVVGQAASLAEARAIIGRETGAVDVALVDLGLPDGYGGDLIRDLRESDPGAQALVLSSSLDLAQTARAVEDGAAGVLHKTAYLGEVVDAVRRLRAGETLLPLEKVVELLRHAGSERERGYEASQAIARLTPREKEVLGALAEGLDTAGIAERLRISVRTVRNHMTSILSKLEVHSQLQALVFALRHGVVEVR